MGTDDRAPNDAELQQMQVMLEEALQAGAIGLSSGLFTTPGGYASSEEMVALGHVLRRHGGAYSSHVRDEANRVFDAVREAIAVG
jgi:N-acyl-D-amino-acid deacylase